MLDTQVTHILDYRFDLVVDRASYQSLKDQLGCALAVCNEVCDELDKAKETIKILQCEKILGIRLAEKREAVLIKLLGVEGYEKVIRDTWHKECIHTV